MKRPTHTIASALAGLAFVAGVAAAAPAAPKPVEWGYGPANGPAKWAKLDKEFGLCGSGQLQSPIDIKDKDVRKGDIPPMLFNYRPAPLRVTDDGRTIVVKAGPDSFLSVNGIRYQLVELRFHHPAEMKIDGKGAAMSVHLLHKDPAGKLGIVAVPVVPGPENPGLKAVWSNLPLEKGKELAPANVVFNPASLLPKTKGYYSFTGSLSTPPCTEGVQWYLLQTPIQATTEQISRLAGRYPNNARPVQPRNDRDVVATPK